MLSEALTCLEGITVTTHTHAPTFDDSSPSQNTGQACTLLNNEVTRKRFRLNPFCYVLQKIQLPFKCLCIFYLKLLDYIWHHYLFLNKETASLWSQQSYYWGLLHMLWLGLFTALSVLWPRGCTNAEIKSSFNRENAWEQEISLYIRVWRNTGTYACSEIPWGNKTLLRAWYICSC